MPSSRYINVSLRVSDGPRALGHIPGAAGGVRHKRFRPSNGLERTLRSWLESLPQSLKLKFSLMIGISSLWRDRAARRVRPARPALCVLRAAEGVLVLPRRRRQRGSASRKAWSASTRRSATSGPDRESSFRNFAELCITRQIITAVKTATRNKHTPLNGYVSFSATPAGASENEPSLDEMLPGSTVHDPVNQVISSEELRSLVACLSTVLSELESRVLSLYLDGHSYTDIGERLGCDCKTVDNALQRVKRKVGAHLAFARRSELDRSYCSHALAHHRPRRPCRADRRRHHRPQPPARQHPPRVRARARAGRAGSRRGRGE